MRFYKIVAAFFAPFINDQDSDSSTDFQNHDAKREMINEYTEQIKRETERFNEQLQGSSFISVYTLKTNKIEMTAIVNSHEKIDKLIQDYLCEISFESNHIQIREVTLRSFCDALRWACRKDFIEDDDDILNDFDLNALSRFRLYFEEAMIETDQEHDSLMNLKPALMSSPLTEELRRIGMGCKTDCVSGHPVHYLIQSDDDESSEMAATLLLESLFAHKRLLSRRKSILEIRAWDHISQKELFAFYEMNAGASIVVKFHGFIDDTGDVATSSYDVIATLCKAIRNHSANTLTLLCLSQECTRLKKYLFESLGSMSFVEIKEEPANEERAKAFLSSLAQEQKVTPNEDLFSRLNKDETYFTLELKALFEDWYATMMKTEIYPQYKTVLSSNIALAKEEIHGSAYDELMALIGLKSAKSVINNAINCHKMQHFLASKEIHREQPSMHMVFTGNPGTAKTTVARLFARIMRENELLSSGHIVEVGRADLVGRYVGHTAPKVREAFMRASGGVLFIDEAYSLIDEKEGMYGDEAITTIVQEMENRRDEVVVIFAGYPNKMEQFLKRNPGLRSRIAHHVFFEDYTTKELCDIAQLIASKKGVILSKGAMEKLNHIFNSARNEIDFGNGRYVRSTIEKALTVQSTRLMKLNLETLGKKKLATICAEDIEMPDSLNRQTRQIGFCA